jgi:hypothetical protein
MVKTPQNEVLHKNGPKIRNQRSILPNPQLKYACFLKDFKIKLKKLKKVFYEKSQKRAFLTKNGKSGEFFPKI